MLTYILTNALVGAILLILSFILLGLALYIYVAIKDHQEKKRYTNYYYHR